MIFRVFCGLGFIWIPLIVLNFPPLLSVLRGPVFTGKNIARFSNLVPQLLSFCKFDFS